MPDLKLHANVSSNFFAATEDIASRANYFRISYSIESKEILKVSAEKFGSIVRQFFKA